MAILNNNVEICGELGIDKTLSTNSINIRDTIRFTNTFYDISSTNNIIKFGVNHTLGNGKPHMVINKDSVNIIGGSTEGNTLFIGKYFNILHNGVKKVLFDGDTTTSITIKKEFIHNVVTYGEYKRAYTVLESNKNTFTTLSLSSAIYQNKSFIINGYRLTLSFLASLAGKHHNFYNTYNFPKDTDGIQRINIIRTSSTSIDYIFGALHNSVKKSINSLLSQEYKITSKYHLIPESNKLTVNVDTSDTILDYNKFKLSNYEKQLTTYWYNDNSTYNYPLLYTAVPTNRSGLVNNFGFYGGCINLANVASGTGMNYRYWHVIKNTANIPSHIAYMKNIVIGGGLDTNLTAQDSFIYSKLITPVMYKTNVIPSQKWSTITDMHILHLNSAIKNVDINVLDNQAEGTLQIFLPYLYEIGESFTINIINFPKNGSIMLNTTHTYTRPEYFCDIYEHDYYGNESSRLIGTKKHLKNMYSDTKGEYYTYFEGVPVQDVHFGDFTNDYIIKESAVYTLPIRFAEEIPNFDNYYIINYNNINKFKVTRNGYQTWIIETI